MVDYSINPEKVKLLLNYPVTYGATPSQTKGNFCRSRTQVWIASSPTASRNDNQKLTLNAIIKQKITTHINTSETTFRFIRKKILVAKTQSTIKNASIITHDN